MVLRVPSSSGMRPYHLVFLSLIVPAVSQAQLLSFGVTGGVPALTPLGATNAIPFAAGPTANVRVSSTLSLETGVMFYRLGQNTQNGTFLYPANSVTTTFSQFKAHAIEVPVLAKLYPLGEKRGWRPFVTAGPALRRTSVESQFSSSTFNGNPASLATVQPGADVQRKTWKVDPVVGAGVDVKVGRFHLDPEVRYSYWREGTNLYPLRKNQVQFLAGFRF
jgi:hypothetical protein